jgi:hypothetical protein
MLLALIFLVAQVQPTASAAAPSPSAAPLKTIVTVKSSLLCTTLRDNLSYAVQGLRINDNMIDQGRLLLSQTAYDSLTSSTGTSHVPDKQRRNPAMLMDTFKLNELSHQLARNIDRIDTLLSDRSRFSDGPTNDEQSQLALAKAQLEAVVAGQKATLNVIAGTASTTDLQDLLSRGDGTQGALQQASHDEGDIDLRNDPVGNSAPTQPVRPAGSLFEQSVYEQLALATRVEQAQIGSAENTLTPTILLIVDECK